MRPGLGFEVPDHLRNRRNEWRMKIGRLLVDVHRFGSHDEVYLPKDMIGQKIGSNVLTSTKPKDFVEEIYSKFAILYPDLPSSISQVTEEYSKLELDTEWTGLVNVTEGVLWGHLFKSSLNNLSRVVVANESRHYAQDQAGLVITADNYLAAHRYYGEPEYMGIFTPKDTLEHLRSWHEKQIDQIAT
jgi:hypothetical protein